MDASSSESMEFWKQQNPEVHAMADSAKVSSPTTYTSLKYV